MQLQLTTKLKYRIDIIEIDRVHMLSIEEN